MDGTHVFPPERGFAVLTVDVCDRVQAREKDPLLRGAAAHVHPAAGGSTALRTPRSPLAPLRPPWVVLSPANRVPEALPPAHHHLS